MGENGTQTTDAIIATVKAGMTRTDAQTLAASLKGAQLSAVARALYLVAGTVTERREALVERATHRLRAQVLRGM